MEWYVLTTREWAAVFWAAVLLVVGVATPYVRRAFAPVMRTLRTSWQLHVAVVAFIGWVALVCNVAHLLGAWDTNLLKDTVAWVLVYGLASIFSATKAAKDDHFFRRAVLAALSVSAAMQFILNLHTFHFAVELFLLPVVTFLILLEGVAAMEARTHPAQRLVNGLLGIIGVWIVVATAWGLWNSWRGIDPKETGLAFAFSLWFPVATLPFVYALSLVMTYGTVLRLSSFRNDGRAPPLPVKVAMLVGMRGNLRIVNDLPTHHSEYRAIARSRSFREALKNVHAYQVTREERQQEKEAKAARLVHYAGVKGQDDDGKLLDQREFKETRDALRWIHTCQMGWHNNLGHYRRDLMTILGDFERQGLPAEHGITMRMSKSGQAWYAWRRTVTGYVFGIGANGPTPNEWLYEGEKPPKGFPGHDSSWGDGPFNTPPNWW
jgi:hypothetical protein